MDNAKGLVKSNRSLKQALAQAKRTKSQFFSVFIPTLHLHLVDESGFVLPVERWNVLNLGSFLKPNSYQVLNPFPSTRVGDVHHERSSVDKLADVVEGYIHSAHQRPYKDPSRSSELPDPVIDLDIFDLPPQVRDRDLLS